MLTLTDHGWLNNPVSERALHVARSYVGERETSHNSGPFVDRFLQAVGLKPGYPWCAAFVYNCLLEAGFPPQKLPSRSRAAAVRNWESWARQHNAIRREPERGYLFYWINANGTGHIGFVRGVESTAAFSTIEGNTNPRGSREGDGVYQNTRTVADLRRRHAHGYIDLLALAAL